MPTLLDIIRSPRHIYHTTSRAGRARLVAVALMQLGLLGALGWSLWHQDWLMVFVSTVGLLSVWLPPILARSWQVHFPVEFELVLNIFIYASIFLGEIQGYYTRFWWWDAVLHFSSGLALGFVGFLIIYALHKTGKLCTYPIVLAVFAFCFALSLGALWEILEFTSDQVFGTNMQKPMLGDPSGLTDTMFDLILDALGALLVSVSGYFYVKYRRPGLGIFDYYVQAYFAKHASHPGQ